MIPKIIHQIWLQGKNNISSDLIPLHDSCIKINKDFQHIFWDEECIKKLLSNYFDPIYLKTFESYKIFAQKADFARYAILYVHGGIYLDMDTLCKKNLATFLENRVFFTATNDILNKIYKRYQTGIIGAIPNHPLFLIVLEKILERVGYSDDVTYSTGTKVFYDSVQDYLLYNDNDIKIVNPKYLHPCGIFDSDSCADTCEDCYIVHVNYSSWSPLMRSIKHVRKYLILYIMIIIIIIFILYMLITKKK